MAQEVWNAGDNYELKMTPVIKYYSNKSIFITGGTGFLGRALVEKLLYACDGIRNIYLLIRNKKDKTAKERFSELLKSSVFQRVRAIKPEVLNKIIPVHGAVEDLCLGMSSHEQAVLCENVSIVFHLAGDINFDTSLKETLDVNVMGTKNMLSLCQKMPHLQALVHVSTAYSNCNKRFIGEKIYPTLASLEAVYHIIENAPDDHSMLNLLENRPNSYTYSKALGEDVIASQHVNIPVAIVRPTIIVSSISEPAPGWVEGWSGANGIIVAIGKGLMRTWPARPDLHGDVIPVDIVANLLIAAAWETHIRSSKGDNDVKIFNCASGLQNPVTIRKFMETCLHYTRKHQFKNVLWYPTLVITKSVLLNRILTFLLQILPAFLIDALSWPFRQKHSMMKIQRKLVKLRTVFEYFTFHEYFFLDYNVKCLHESMMQEDRRIFNIDIKSVDWERFLENYVIGLKKYLLNEGVDDENVDFVN